MNSTNSLWIALLLVWIAGSAWWHVCKIKLLCEMPATAPPAQLAAPEKPVLHIMDGASLMLTAPGNFSFARSGSRPDFFKIRSEIDSVARYLQSVPEKRLVLTGSFSEDEINITTWPNLGVARAEEVKAYYLSLGVEPSVVITRGEQNEGFVFAGDSLWGGIDFHFTDALTLTENSLAEQQKFEDIFKPLDLYFNTGGSDYIKTPDNERFLEEALLYLSQNRDQKIRVTGHTDNVGASSDNLSLSEERAGAVKDYLIEAGVPAGQIEVEAKGQTEPKAQNDTPEGQAVNRRVTIVVSR